MLQFNYYGLSKPYIASILYDEYEQRIQQEYGNGVISTYNYDNMRRLILVSTSSINVGNHLQEITYNYDQVGNIASIINDAMDTFTHEYSYDSDNRLLSALSSGTFDGDYITNDYKVTYSPSGKITNKTFAGETLEDFGVNPFQVNYDYHYQGSRTQQMSEAVENISGNKENFGWDDKGNMNYQSNNYIGERRLCWTEDNRLQGFSDRRNGAYYGYDASGERALKLTGPTIHVNQNGMDYYSPILQSTTLYASPLITLRDGDYTKHYFEEGKRICSKIGSGELRDINNLVGHMEMNYEDQLTTQYEGMKDGNRGCIGGGWFDLENNNLYKSIIQPYENPMNPDEPIFYYHSDHLGSASFLTDRDGKETQQLVYLPFGELRSNREYLNVKNQNSHEQHWVDMKYNTGQYDTPYKFNGKEKDEELRSNREYNNINNKYHEQTGYNNYGARYYYDWATIWLSVDPMSDKYPHQSNYVYCNNNPVIYIDPNGEEGLNWFRKDGNSSDASLHRLVNKFKTDGAIHVYTHGFPRGLKGPNIIQTRKGKVQETLTPKSFVERLKNSEVWKNRKDGESITIVLHACRTGRETYDESGNRHASFAEELSKLEEMKDVYIIAPTERDYFDDDGEVGTYKAKLADRNGEYLRDKDNKIKNMERSSKTGEWITYKNGKKVDSH